MPVTVAAPRAIVPAKATSATPTIEARDEAAGTPAESPALQVLTAPNELPTASRALVRTLLLLTQAMYLAFYLGALANVPEIAEIFTEARLLSPTILTALLVASAVVLIPVRLYLSAAVAFDFQHLHAKFNRLFPALLVMDLLWALSPWCSFRCGCKFDRLLPPLLAMDLLWALSPFLLIHHISLGLALGMTAALVYMPFAQRSLVLMYTRDRARQ